MEKIKELEKGYFKKDGHEIEKVYFQFKDKKYLLKKEERPLEYSGNGEEINLYEIPDKSNQRENEKISLIFENFYPIVSDNLMKLGEHSRNNDLDSETELNSEFENVLLLNFEDKKSRLIIKTEENNKPNSSMLKKLIYNYGINGDKCEDVVLFDKGESYSYHYMNGNRLFYEREKNSNFLKENGKVNEDYLRKLNHLIGAIEQNADEIKIDDNGRLFCPKTIEKAIRDYEIIRENGTREKLGKIIEKNLKEDNKKNSFVR